MYKYTWFLVFSFIFISFLGFNVSTASATPDYPAGCTSTVGYSPTTGIKCDTAIDISLPTGCTSTVGYSPTTGVKCDTATSSSANNANLATITIRPANSTGKTYKPGQTDVILGEFNFSASSGTGSIFSGLGFWGFMANSYGNYNKYTPSIPSHFENLSLWVNGKMLGQGSVSSDGVISFPGSFFVDNNLPAKVSIRADVVPGTGNATYSFTLANYGYDGNPINYLDSSRMVFTGRDSEVRIVSSTSTISARQEDISNLYRTLLKREPDIAGLNYWNNTSMNIEQIKRYFMNSTEYKNLNTTTQPSITVLSPNRGETWERGTTKNITWKSNQPTKNVTIEVRSYPLQETPSDAIVIANDVPNTGTYSWNVGKYIFNDLRGQSGKYLMEVCTIGVGGVCDQSDITFTIAAPTVSPRLEDISNLYRTLLKREPDAAGLNYWNNTTMSIEQIKKSLMNSTEYKNLNTTSTTGNSA